MLRKVEDQRLSIWRAKSIPRTFRSTNPATSMPNRGGRCRYGILPTRKPKRLAETITMNIPNMFPPGKASWPITDQRTAQIKITTSPRVATWPKNPLGGTIPASRNRFFKPDSFIVSSFLDSVVVWSPHTGLSMTNLCKKGRMNNYQTPSCMRWPVIPNVCFVPGVTRSRLKGPRAQFSKRGRFRCPNYIWRCEQNCELACEKELLFARQLTPWKCSLCSQGRLYYS